MRKEGWQTECAHGATATRDLSKGQEHRPNNTHKLTRYILLVYPVMNRKGSVKTRRCFMGGCMLELELASFLLIMNNHQNITQLSTSPETVGALNQPVF